MPRNVVYFVRNNQLGKKVDPSITEDRKAQQIGSIQFKVSLRMLRDEFNRSDWAKKNILIAVAGGSDGSSGVRDDADTTLRAEIEKFAHIIFASSRSQRDFWLGKKSLSSTQIEERYGALKPCMHGSDAHTHETVGAPKGDRFTWIKGAPRFDSLRQACIDPEGRAFVADHPPFGATPSQVIQQIDINNTNWCDTPKIRLNSGLVAIIGARGSGKTALAEIIASGCDAIADHGIGGEKDKSFLYRAQSELQGSTVSVHWGEERESVIRALDIPYQASDKYPMARYLSQQFVDDLCSSDGITDKLLKELERIIFSSHDVNQREGTLDFTSLLELKATRPRAARAHHEKSLEDLCDRIGLEIEKTKLVADTKSKIVAKETTIRQYTVDQSKLVVAGNEERVKRLGALTQAADVVRGYVRVFSQMEQTLLGMKDDVSNLRLNTAPEALRDMQARHLQAGIKVGEWDAFLTDFKGDVDTVIAEKLAEAKKNAGQWKGQPPTITAPGTDLIAADADLTRQTLSLLDAEIARISLLVSADKTTAQRYLAITQKIALEQTALNVLKENLTDYEGAKSRVDALRKERDASYGRVFEAVLEEVAILNELYIPIMDRLGSAEGTLKKMSFSIKRSVDVAQWAGRGERFFDLREQGPFKGRGTLRQLAEEILLPAWKSGNVQDVLDAMKKFRDETDEEFISASRVLRTEKGDLRAWAMQFAKWLYSTDHIHITYGVDYDGVDIRKLSPGTRGIVLLLLYLALDDEDDRPLIIDQPEENLDPKSIYDELVGLFVAAKQKRQVIMVTHNANLVVNTDADQIIIASTGERLPTGMPKISYMSGGLEEAHIRKEVCGILEGGEIAFQKRAHRLRVPLR